MSKYRQPFRPTRRITDPYGWRTHPITGQRQHHNGTDYAAPAGTRIRGVARGRVSAKGYNAAGFGHWVMVEHRCGVVSLYAHMQQASHRKIGSRVRWFTKKFVGRVGTTGASTGNHLHLEIRVDGKLVNPARYIANH
jgi:murein DD-endopeptidase MepM/ murein hydrolase activator NlpD